MQGKQAVLTVVNPDLKNAAETEIAVRGAQIHDSKVTVLTSTDMRAHNTLDQPHALEARQDESPMPGPQFVYTFKPASVTRLELSLS